MGDPSRQLNRRQARQLMDTAYLAAATALLWVALYYLPVGSPLFRLALPLPLALLQLRHGWRCAVEGLVVTALLLVALMGPIRGPLVIFPYGSLALWLGWCWRRRASWWLSWSVGSLIGVAGLALGSGPLLAGVFVAVAGAGGLGPEGAGVGAGAGGAEKLPANWSPNGVPLQPASSRQPATSTKLRRPAAAISDRPP